MLRKKIAICIVALIIALSIFAGCETEDTTTTTAQSTTTTTTKQSTTTTTVRPTETTTVVQDETTTTTKAPDTTTTTKKPTTTTTTTTTIEPLPENYDIAYKKISYTDSYGWGYENEYNEKGLLIKRTEKNRSVEYEYDAEGNLTREVEYDRGRKYETTFDKHGNVIIATAHDENGELLSTTRFSYEYEYYPNGTISYEKQYLEYRTDEHDEHRSIGEILYNKDGNPIYSDIHDDFWWKTRYEYDENGRLIKKVTDALSYDYTDTTVYEYDANGNLVLRILTTTQDPESGNVGIRTEYEYDNYGNETKEASYYEDGRTFIHTTEYEYGEDGAIETETTYFNGELSGVTTYENPFKIYK